MANQKISQMPSLTASELAAGDLLAVVDVSDVTQASSGSNKKITVTELQSAAVSAGTANGVLYLNASKQLTSGSALTFDGANLAVGSATAFGNKLYVAGNISASGEMRADTPTAGTSLVLTGTGSNFQVSHATSGFVTLLNSGGGLIFSPEATEQMRLTSTGLGIGTSSPVVKLDVNGNANLVAGGQLIWGGAYNYYIQSDNSTYLRFATGASERMRLDSSGNLGLGVTPSAWRGRIASQVYSVSIAATPGSPSIGEFSTNRYLSDGLDKYIYSAPATVYQHDRGAHKWFTAPSGTAGDAISFTQAMTLDTSGTLILAAGDFQFNRTSAFLYANGGSGGNVNSGFYLDGSGNTLRMYTGSAERARIDSSGNLGIGTTTPSQRIDAVTSGGSSYIRNHNGTIESFSGVSEAVGGAVYGTGNNYPVTFFANGAERARIDNSGNLLVGTSTTEGVGTTVYGAGLLYSRRSESNAATFRRDTSDGSVVIFKRDSTDVGSISITTTATTYNTSSDYRLKNITGPIANSGTYIDSLNPVEGTWKADGSTFVGLIAHEVQEVSRTQVATGEKDGAEMQAMDYSNSELIANLIAEVKSLRARVAALESN